MFLSFDYLKVYLTYYVESGLHSQFSDLLQAE